MARLTKTSVKNEKGDYDKELKLWRRDTPKADSGFPTFTLVVLRNKQRQIERIHCQCGMRSDDQRGQTAAPVGSVVWKRRKLDAAVITVAYYCTSKVKKTSWSV